MYYVESADREEAYVTDGSSSTWPPSSPHSDECVDGWIGGDRCDPLVPCREHRPDLWARLDSRRRRRQRPAAVRRPA